MADENKGQIEVTTQTTATEANIDTKKDEVVGSDSTSGQTAPKSGGAPSSKTAPGQSQPLATPGNTTNASGGQPTPTQGNQTPETDDSLDQNNQNQPEEEKEKKKEKEGEDKEKPGEKNGENAGEGEIPGEPTTGEPIGEPPAGELPTGEAGATGEVATGAEGTAGLGAEGAAAGEAAATGEAAAAAGGAEAAGVAAAEGAAAVAAEGAEVAAGAAAAPVLLIILGVVVVILLIVIIIFGVMACEANAGQFGKSTPIPSGTSYANVATVLSAATTGAKTPAGKAITGQNKLNINATDQKFIQDGKADKRLLDALNYVSGKHSSLTISRVINGFQTPAGTTGSAGSTGATGSTGSTSTTGQNTPTDPEFGGDNVSAHAEGLAADISTIDDVYKTDQVSQTCQQAAAALCGPFSPLCKSIVSTIKLGNLIYYSDQQDSNSDTTAAPADLDDAAINAQISAQQIILTNAQSALTQAKTDFGNLKSQTSQALTNLQKVKSNNNLTADQQNQLQTQINKMQNISSTVSDMESKVDSYNQQIISYGQSIANLQKQLSQLKTNLQNIEKLNDKLGSNKVSDVDSTVNSMVSDINQIFPKLNDAATQIQNVTTIVSSLDSTSQVNIQAVVTATGSDASYIAGYLSDVSAATGSAGSNNTSSMDGMSQSESNLEGFAKEIDSLIQATAGKTLNQLEDAAKQQLETAIKSQLDDSLSSLGVGPIGSNELLFLPCVGFVVPGLSSIPGASDISGTISNITNSDLTKNIMSNVNDVESQANQASNELSNDSKQISTATKTVNSQIQKLYDTMAPTIKTVTMAISKTNSVSTGYLNDIDKAAGAAQGISSGNVSINQSQLNSLQSEITSLIQGAASQSFNLTNSASTTTNTSQVKQNVATAQAGLTQDKATVENIKSQFTDLANSLNQGKATLSIDISGSNSPITVTERTQIQNQINTIQTLLSTVNTVTNQINTYEQQLNTVYQAIGQAQSALTQLTDTLNKAKSLYNQIAGIPGKLNKLIAQIIPSAMIPYAVVPNTTFNGNQYSQAVPIQVKWQDDSPGSQYVGSQTDDKSIINDLIFYLVYRPEARRKVHQFIEDTLQMPTTLNNQYYYRPSQLITFSDSRDVQPFSDILKSLYDLPRPANLGLFAMPQAWSEIHIAY